MLSGLVIGHDGEGLAGFAVSNGVDVCTTDDIGRWSLPKSDQPFVWVHRNAGFDCRNWYQPADTLEPIFEVETAPSRARFAHVTDLHVDSRGDDEAGLLWVNGSNAGLGDVFRELAAGLGRDFVVATGDLTNRGVVSEYEKVSAELAGSPIPVYVIPGNHDHYGAFFEPEPIIGDDGENPPPSGWWYESHFGPRWFSFTDGGLRFVVVDWHSWDQGVDGDIQAAWLTADLATALPGTPVMVLSHDLMPKAFFEKIETDSPHVKVIGSLSGHWHTVRSSRRGGQLHINSGNARFGSWDWSPPHARLLEFDGASLGVETVALGVATESRHLSFSIRRSGRDDDQALPSGADWRIDLPGVNHLGGPVVMGAGADALCVVGWRDEDAITGGVTAASTDTGEVMWTADLGNPVIASVEIVGQNIIAATLDGAISQLDGKSGRKVWTSQLEDPQGLWLSTRPTVAADVVVAGSGQSFAGLSAGDGSPVWVRGDLGSGEMYPSYGHGVADAGRVFVGFPYSEPSLFALDAASGRTIWSGGGSHASSPAGSLAMGDDGHLYGLTHEPELFCVDAATGSQVFNIKVDGHYTWCEPLVTNSEVIVVSGDGRVSCHDPLNGGVRWVVDLPASNAMAFVPYSGPGRGSVTPPIEFRGRIVTATTDGSVWSLDPSSGDVDRLVCLPAPVVSGIATSGSKLMVATADGSLWSVS